ncbi:unnamed protein product [Candida verbasci]|uniref:Ubiquitin-like protein ATG12 n=1 Tax=Candida verbasci TaxID=1227364 RepID=A0A9W4TU97_9ASCO|nr:unnamed protein product [Candida verbasci]
MSQVEDDENEEINDLNIVDQKVPLSTSIILDKSIVKKEPEITKITIRFQPIGSAKSIEPRVFKISSNQTISTLNKFLTKKLKSKELLRLYVQNSFQPLPDEKIGDLYNLFKTNNELIVTYCNTVAFG